MMLKFKAWDKDKKVMSIIDEIDFNSGYILISTGYKSFDEVKLLQYTGLKDKNNTEIYDGDIAEFKYPHDKRFKEIGIITHSAEKACFVIKMIRDTVQEFELYRGVANSYLKVIGNKFENPELLEESE
ncbi:YopX family protein [Staphylococcus aureus]|uniref:YopX family protein n=1 Tax=Staphylococcus aureus TaxID=1280 RepID=UPI003EE3B25F